MTSGAQRPSSSGDRLGEASRLIETDGTYHDHDPVLLAADDLTGAD
jgi:hypothetical protein